ncbi:MAG: co-chaperone GroES [Lentisphaeria bacterium]|nr:co-chaperone GroES [Lentisphaeria bacterium]
MSVKIQPLGDRVLVQAVTDTQEMQGGIYIPDSAQEKPQEATVVALGTGGKDKNGDEIVFNVKVGDIVLTSKYGGTEVKSEGEEYKILSQGDILAVVNP